MARAGGALCINAPRMDEPVRRPRRRRCPCRQARAPAPSSLLHRRHHPACQPAAGGDVLEVIALPPSPDEVAREALVARAALGRHRSASWSAPPQVSATWLVRRTPCDGPPDDDATWGEYVADGVSFVARAVPWRLDPRERRPERARLPPASAQTFFARPKCLARGAP